MKKLTALLIIFLAFNLQAAEQTQLSPYQEIKMVGDKLFGRIASSQQELTKFPELMREIVEKELIPSVD